ncbi:SAF domain-containing protein [Egicoccus sp. AB-alg2]|uniref:SAF domain-containing protein n=1 Tax=Egicoccus sp. AB-alg2 TaxID=3242693 RepID=UPI00359EEA02
MSTTTPPAAKTRQPRGRAPDLRLDPPAGQARRPKLSWVALGLAVVLAGGLFGAVTLARVADRAPVLALAMPIERGETLTDDHLRVVDVAADEQLPLVTADDRLQLVGLTATGPLPAGSLVTREQFSDGPQVADGFSVVGLALQPGEYPIAALTPGDRVEVVRTPDPTGVRSDGGSGAAVLTDDAEVYAVGPLSETSAGLMVSLTVPQDTGPAIASAAAEGRVRLVLVPAS